MSETPSPVRSAMGWMLLLLGALWLVLTGGCTLTFLGGVLMSAFRAPQSENAMGVALVVVVGALCAAPGAGLLWLGLSMVKQKRTTAR